MENVNQDAMLHQQRPTYKSDTGGPLQIPDQTLMMGDEASANVSRMVDNNFTDMAPSDGAHDASASVGNNDGNLPDPETIELTEVDAPIPETDEDKVTNSEE